tara:strand:+ start:976 stop:1197 length:222 start_codon:yes stop_codon:yes gene_type:complete
VGVEVHLLVVEVVVELEVIEHQDTDLPHYEDLLYLFQVLDLKILQLQLVVGELVNMLLHQQVLQQEVIQYLVQ